MKWEKRFSKGNANFEKNGKGTTYPRAGFYHQIKGSAFGSYHKYLIKIQLQNTTELQPHYLNQN